MKTTTMQQLDDSDLSKVKTLIKLGVTRVEAKMIVYLIVCGSAPVPEISAGAYLVQPEVSIAAGRLAKRGWISRDVVKTERRPLYVYSSTVTLAQIAAQLRAENDERQAEFMRMFGELTGDVCGGSSNEN